MRLNIDAWWTARISGNGCDIVGWYAAKQEDETLASNVRA